MSGAASGFLKTSWKTLPAKPSPAPASSAITVRGSRRFIKTDRDIGSTSPPVRILAMSEADIGNLPISRAAAKAAITRSPVIMKCLT
jgi:hypothetical protein